MDKFSRGIVKSRFVIFIISLVLLIPSFFGYISTRVNYDVLSYLPKDIETMVGQDVLMDDFGSGYSSLNVLKDIDLDVLKIDMKFLSKGKDDGRGEKILAAVIQMAKALDMPVIAEGVEEKKQVQMLKRLGCNYIQGYYFAKPMPQEDYERLARKSHE